MTSEKLDFTNTFINFQFESNNFGKNPEDKYIWYQCVPTILKSGYNCYEIDKNNYTSLPNSTLTFVNKNIPRFLHKPIIFIDMIPSIQIHKKQ